MKEGQGTASASLPWGEADDAGSNAGPVDVPSSTSGDSGRGQDEVAEPHVRVDARKLEGALIDVRNVIRRLPLLLDSPGIDAVRAERQQLVNQIDDYLLPRLRQSGAPILIAMVGSTGAGKSTLLNSIVGSQVSATGIRRPTTNSPVLACHPEEVKWFAENVFLPTLPRVRQQGLAMPGRDGLLVLATSPGMPRAQDRERDASGSPARRSGAEQVRRSRACDDLAQDRTAPRRWPGTFPACASTSPRPVS